MSGESSTQGKDVAQHRTIFLPSDQSCTTARKIREAVSTSFQTTPHALCRSCCVCWYFTTRQSPAFTPCPSRARTCIQSCLCTARSLVKSRRLVVVFKAAPHLPEKCLGLTSRCFTPRSFHGAVGATTFGKRPSASSEPCQCLSSASLPPLRDSSPKGSSS